MSQRTSHDFAHFFHRSVRSVSSHASGLMGGRNHETTVDTPLRIEPFGTRAAVEALTPSFSLPPLAFDYHEPALSGPFHKPTDHRAAFRRNVKHTWKRMSCRSPVIRSPTVDGHTHPVVTPNRSQLRSVASYLPHGRGCRGSLPPPARRVTTPRCVPRRCWSVSSALRRRAAPSG